MYLEISGTNVRLLGSMHMVPALAPELPAWVREAYEWAEILVLESETETVLPFMRSAWPGPLRSIVSPAVWTTLESIWPTDGPLSPLASVHPWAALLVAAALCQDVSIGVEPHFIKWAAAQAKPVVYLETAQELATRFAAVPQDEIAACLALFTSDLAEPQRALTGIHEAWLRKDMEAVYRAASRSPTFAFPALRNAVLEARNRAWAPRVEHMLAAEKRTLVVVGALHLHGRDNLIELLDCDTILR